MVRHLIILKNLGRIFKHLISRNAIIPVWLNNKALNEGINTSIIAFVVIYFAVFLAGSIVLLMIGIDGKRHLVL